MKICYYCLANARSHGEEIYAMPFFVDANDENKSKCDFCGESGNDELYKII